MHTHMIQAHHEINITLTVYILSLSTQKYSNVILHLLSEIDKHIKIEISTLENTRESHI